MSNVRATLVLIPVLAFVLLIPTLIGIYVYRDAKQRKMNVALWTIIAVVAPSLIGFIIYLLVRGNYSNMECPQCHATVSEQYVSCPKCGTRLRPSCPNCTAPVEPDWSVCPQCGTALPEQKNDFAAPVRREDKGLWKILAAVIIVPLVLLCILFINFAALDSYVSASTSIQEVSFDEYYREQQFSEISTNVETWLSHLDAEAGRAYALRYDYSQETENRHFYLIYVPGAGKQPHINMGQTSNLFGTYLTLELYPTGNDGFLLCIESSADKPPVLKIKLNNKHISCDVTEVDYNPTLFFVVPKYDEIEPSSKDFFMPERLSVVKLINNANMGVEEIADEDLKLKILAAIDGSAYIDMDDPIYSKSRPDGTGGYDFKDGFDIIIEYKVQEDLILHEDLIHCLVFEQNGKYYLIDSYRPDNSRIFREINADFYQLLKSLFENQP